MSARRPGGRTLIGGESVVTSVRRILEERVVADWLRVERRRPHADPDRADVDALSPAERRARLDDLTPATWVFETPRVWYRATLTPAVLRRAQHPWKRLGLPRGSALDLARAIAAEDPGVEWAEALAEHEELVAGIEAKTEALPASLDGPLVLACRFGDPPFLVDGTHRAAAVALGWLRTETFHAPEASLGFECRTSLTTALGRAGALAFRLRYRV